MCYHTDGSAIFSGLETIRGNINGQQGVLVLAHQGTFKKGVASSQFTVVTDACDGVFEKFTGRGEFTTGEHGSAQYVIELSQP
ncbi:hypothetical protein PALB_8680 [Pseudoalteromonas luteoviolacea B = ATCC 29581]|nr:hypothetical protein PALB_8680 [Pseudoalteromonas luteoviolacea B = ATCC 29581]